MKACSSLSGISEALPAASLWFAASETMEISGHHQAKI